ncbi:YicS family protein (plasmid) [Pantoea agglomerans]|nr:YicS family protein [Pantoea agglomerans]WIL44339.1 YicS family protein [Pantoea agglomerans]
MRQTCQLPPAFSDEKLRQTFLNDKHNLKQNQLTLTAAAQALKNQDNPAYRERMAQVVCPPQTD